MSFRNDHEATLARADALERALAKQLKKLHATERERARLAALVKRYAAGETVEPAPAPVGTIESDYSIWTLVSVMAVLLALVILIANW